MKSPLILAVLLLAAPAFADAPFQIIETKTPAMCQSESMPAPMPCAFLLAMIQKMRAKCGGEACNNKTCALKGI